jgi:uncharacterized protein (TIGR03437 family)
MGVKHYILRQTAILLTVAGLLLCPLAAQAQTTVIGAGYATPQPINVSPGQVITIFAAVAGKQASPSVTANPPLPTSLGGFSVLLRQTYIDPMLIPVSAVSDAQSCSTIPPLQCDTVSQITVQIPFELMPNIPHVSVPQNFARLEISYNNNQTGSLFLNPVPDSMHVLNSCDVGSGVSQADGCLPVVAHNDGSLVTSGNPAAAGETVTMSLVGMGQPAGEVTTGVAAALITPALDGVLISYDARTNASPSLLVPTSAFPENAAQLRPGTVGIYDVPVLVPALPAGVAACSSTVKSNLTVNISRATSFDGVGICVAPAAQ